MWTNGTLEIAVDVKASLRRLVQSMPAESKVPYDARAAIATASVEHFNTAGLRNAFESAGFEPATGSNKLDTARTYLMQLDRSERP